MNNEPEKGDVAIDDDTEYEVFKKMVTTWKPMTTDGVMEVFEDVMDAFKSDLSDIIQEDISDYFVDINAFSADVP